MASPILWQSSDQSITVIDVPRSISSAQGTTHSPCLDTPLSSEPLQRPFPSNEPKSAAAKAKLQDNTVNDRFNASYMHKLQQALEQVRRHHQGDWCYPRPFVAASKRPAKKRKLKDDQEGQEGGQTSPCRSPPELPCDMSFTSNDSAESEAFQVASTVRDRSAEIYHIPPFATFSLSDCAESRSFTNSIRNQAQEDSARRHFDLILMDPPWPNRSVKRTHKTPGSSYATSTTLADIHQLILGMDLDMLMADNCLVGIWITNKPAVRELVLGEDGIFASWGIELGEEWIWLKTTVNGEPVSPLDSLWRKPYEVLLVGRRFRSGQPSSRQDDIKRRTIFGVPDLHSRKPCLKSLFEPMMADAQDYRALEVFARHLVAGWWSWGNECIKFNWSGYWQSQVAAPAPLTEG